jgi:hypothetical protein
MVVLAVTLGAMASWLVDASLVGAQYAAFLTVQYPPLAQQLESMPVTALDPSWTHVSILTKGNQPPDVLREVEALGEPYGARFEVAGDFNRDGNTDRALVGVYRDIHGGTGRFLLILTRNTANSWKSAYLLAIPGEPGFSILYERKTASGGSHIIWSHCMSCDSFATVRWENGAYKRS